LPVLGGFPSTGALVEVSVDAAGALVDVFVSEEAGAFVEVDEEVEDGLEESSLLQPEVASATVSKASKGATRRRVLFMAFQRKCHARTPIRHHNPFSPRRLFFHDPSRKPSLHHAKSKGNRTTFPLHRASCLSQKTMLNKKPSPGPVAQLDRATLS